ncbi:STAS domain-containing protein [Bacillus sp. JCM 19034]|uniref:STAS domain-containing protein n=1 Tax=Bacillus sp. JCM 19034 TaxID=1481928 RepID=UPI0007864D0E|nr:STAS domain-containing protein [Bacillus sp. JCM 19034]
MGLTQVYTTVYDHQGVIKVHSEINVGTTFTLYFPIPIKQELGVVKLNLMFEENQEFKEFYLTNQKKFADLLSEEGSSVFERMKETNDFDNQFLLAATHKIILLLNDTDEYGLIMHAKEHGRNWAELNLELILIMEWFQTFRKLYWDFIYNYYENKQVEHKEFFELERLVNYKLDTYLKHFASSFSEYTQQVILSQNELIDDLSVPIIPISNEMAILPIVGSVDTRRAKNIQLKSLEQIHKQNFQHIIIDLSGVAYMDTGVLDHLFNIVNGIRIQGCQTVLTGIRPEITNTIVELGIDLHEKVETKGTLQQAIADYNVSILKS